MKKNIFNAEVKDSFLTNYTRAQVVRFYSYCNYIILDSGAEVTTKIADRLFEASQKVWLRDFPPTFFANAAKRYQDTFELLCKHYQHQHC